MKNKEIYESPTLLIAGLALLAEHGSYVDLDLNEQPTLPGGKTETLGVMLDLDKLGLLKVERSEWFTFFSLNDKGKELVTKMSELIMPHYALIDELGKLVVSSKVE